MSHGKLDSKIQLKIFDLMVKSRVLELRLIQIYKLGEGFFWIGGPGEEAFGVPLGLLVNCGQGIEHDWLHLHYRSTPTMVALGLPMVDAIRLMMNKATDKCTGGRNFAGHFAYPEWNVAPVSSPIEIQYGVAVGTAIAQKRHNSKGITIVTGGDAGTAEGDFASSLIWATRKGNELPMLITVQNNGWGISTRYETQHGEENIADRGKAFRMRTAVYNGNDPVESYLGLKREFEYVRTTRLPSLVEFKVSRLYGHSSADGANLHQNEPDCITIFEEKLISQKILTKEKAQEIWKKYDEEVKKATNEVRAEPNPESRAIWDHVFVNNENADWRKF
ncbi:MAG: thiamine pyrophosphate-dependent dehydrogenase E1 component subunit alpha [Pseudomonadota bacterium]|nr:thiamine pyrophosphate-dependent dehydrogenase E1 component subunit alpha [Pseudomonadota bacterium]